MKSATTGPAVVEPVHWGSRLLRAPGVHYTEVAGGPCLVTEASGDIVLLTPTWAAIWAQLDGRTVTETFRVDSEELDPVDARNLIEVLRRLKGQRLIGDVDPENPAGRAQDLRASEGVGSALRVVFHGSLVRTPQGTELVIDPDAPELVRVLLADRPDGVAVTCRRLLRRRTVREVRVPDAPHPHTTTHTTAAFATVVRALEDRSVLSTPGLVDLLAGLAERAAPPGSPRR